MKKAVLYTIFALTAFLGVANGQPDNRNTAFKVVGYIFVSGKQPVTTNTNYLEKITHLNIAFINPDSAGNFSAGLPISDLIDKAHQKNVKVLASIGGGGSHPYYGNLLTDSNRGNFIERLLSMADHYQFDGIDVDLEGSDIGPNYTKFVVELAAVLHKKNKLITSAIATAYKDLLADEALHAYDFVNIMSYDRTGPWRPTDAGDHSPFTMAVEDLDYWHNSRRIPTEKLVLGLPFYGYGFGNPGSAVVSMNYAQISSLYPDELTDTLKMPGDVVMYFNNISTIKRKTKLALEKGGGVMIWQLAGDASGEKSLLNAIESTIKNQN